METSENLVRKANWNTNMAAVTSCIFTKNQYEPTISKSIKFEDWDLETKVMHMSQNKTRMS
jgi:hypothetical protein